MAELSEEQLRIRGYLQGQAAKLSVHDLIVKVRADSAQLREAALAAEEGDWMAAPAAGEWSANDVLGHVVSTCNDIYAGILGALEAGVRARALPDALRHEQAGKRPSAWWDELSVAREALFARLETAAGDEHLDAVWAHPFFGDLNWREWLLFLRIHDLDHAGQIVAIVASERA